MATTDIIGPPGYGSLDGDNDYIDDFNGTSASAPVISGVYALMFAVNERLTAAEARDVMCDTAVRMDLEGGEWDENGWSQWYGCGRVDAGAAVRAVYNEGPPDAPVIEGPIGDVEEGRVLLEWTVPEDPDGDRLTYKLKWWVTGDPDNDRNEVTDRPWLDLSEELPVGAEITYKVRALDMWGSGEWSLEQSLSVVRPEVQEIQVEDQRGGCTVAPTHSMPAIAILAILMAGIRRRT